MICYIVYQSPWWKRLNQTVSGSVHSVHMVRNLRHCPILYTGSFHWALPGKSCCYTFSESVKKENPPKAIDKTIRKWDCFDQVCTSTEINSLWQYANRLKTTNFCDVPFSWFMTDIKKSRFCILPASTIIDRCGIMYSEGFSDVVQGHSCFLY